jgi:hypothetical protein
MIGEFRSVVGVDKTGYASDLSGGEVKSMLLPLFLFPLFD